MAATGASCSPKWSGMRRAEYPSASARRAWSAQDRAVPSGALESWAANRNFRGCAMGDMLPQRCPACRPPRPYREAGRLEEAELGDTRIDPLEEIALGRHQLGRGPRVVTVDLTDRVEAAHGVDVDDEDLAVHVGRRVGGQEGDQLGDVLGVPFVETLVLLGRHLAEEVLGHPGPGPRCDGVGRDAVALQLSGEH